jgi:DNA polymerase-3 subunit epsilon
MRQIVLDTETTGLEPADGHRIIEIGCVELINRRRTDNRFRTYLNPERDIDDGAQDVHGIDREKLRDSPRFDAIAAEFIEYVRGAELIIHNAPFDVGFINAELIRLGTGWGRIEDYCPVLDTLTLAREMHPGQRNSLDALCKRYGVDNSAREFHGAMLDAELLTDVYLAMTGGQASLLLDDQGRPDSHVGAGGRSALRKNRPALRIVHPTAEESALHEQRLAAIDKASGGSCVWLRLETSGNAGPGNP